MSQQKLLIVTDGLISAEDGYVLHPALHSWHDQLHRCSRQWFQSRAKTPVEWYASLTNDSAAELFVSSLNDNAVESESLKGYQQAWIASPFHALLGRDQLRVMPDALFPWREDGALWLCDLLNPLLDEEGMRLVHQKAGLALLCREPLDASPVSFANVSGYTLPNRHPEGRDGGRFMRLMAEIQMVLKQKPAEHRRLAGEPDVDGLWFWGGSELMKHSNSSVNIPVSTRSPLLRSITDAKDASVIISESDALSELLQPDQPLPKQVVLAGIDMAVCLKRSILPKFGKPSWKPKSRYTGEESALLTHITLK